MREKKQKYAYWMYPSMVSEIEEMVPEANVRSKGEFVCKAVDFYIGYLRSQKNLNYLSPVLASAIKSEIRSVEHISVKCCSRLRWNKRSTVTFLLFNMNVIQIFCADCVKTVQKWLRETMAS